MYISTYLKVSLLTGSWYSALKNPRTTIMSHQTTMRVMLSVMTREVLTQTRLSMSKEYSQRSSSINRKILNGLFQKIIYQMLKHIHIWKDTLLAMPFRTGLSLQFSLHMIRLIQTNANGIPILWNTSILSFESGSFNPTKRCLLFTGKGEKTSF